MIHTFQHFILLILLLLLFQEGMRIVASSVSGSVTRGASRNCIERNTFPHKHIKRNVAQPATAADSGDEPPPTAEEDEEGDKCTICLSEFEVDLSIPSIYLHFSYFISIPSIYFFYLHIKYLFYLSIYSTSYDICFLALSYLNLFPFLTVIFLKPILLDFLLVQLT